MQRAVFFDFDGTLAHTAPDMVAALHEWQQSREQPLIDYSLAKMAVSGGARALLALTGMTEEDEEYEAARLDFLWHYESSRYRRTFLFSGMKQLLRELHATNWQWGVVTNKPRQYFAPIAEMMSLDTNPDIELPFDAPPLAAALVAGDDCVKAKPSPESLLLAAQIAGIPPENCIYIGDDVRDAMAAQAAGMPFILAAWGYWAANEWHRAPVAAAIATTPRDIGPLVKMLGGHIGC